MEIKVTIKNNIDFNQIKDGVRDEIKKIIKQNTIKLTNYIKNDKLTNNVLRVRTGRLRNSIHSYFVENQNSFYGYASTNVEYARVHEFGFKGQVNVKQHLRNIKTAFGKSISPKTITIKGHTRNVNFPERSFMRTALAEIRQGLEQDLANNILKVVKK